MRRTRLHHWSLLLNTAVISSSLLFEFAVPAPVHSVAVPASTAGQQATITSSPARKAPYKEVRIKRLTQDDIAYGEQQIQSMLHDRPRMARYVKKGDRIWNWTVRQFGGEALGSRIRWNNAAPAGDFAGDHLGPIGRELGFIRVQEALNGVLVDGEKQWSSAIYELHNIRSSPGFESVVVDANSGKLTRDEYVRRMTELELMADIQESSFYHSVWLPHARASKVSATSAYWSVNEPVDYKTWIAGSDSRYISVYADFFDKKIMPYVTRNVEYTKQKAKYDREKSEYERQKAMYDIPTRESKERALAISLSKLQSEKRYLDFDDSEANRFDSVLRALNKGVVEVEIKTLEGTGGALCSSGNFKDALPFYEQVVEISAKDLGPTHPDHVLVINNLAIINHELKQYDEAERLYKQVLEVREKAVGSNDPLVIETLKHLLAVYRVQSKTYEAAAIGRRISAIDLEEYDFDVQNTDAIKSGF